MPSVLLAVGCYPAMQAARMRSANRHIGVHHRDRPEPAVGIPADVFSGDIRLGAVHLELAGMRRVPLGGSVDGRQQ
jgi:hypothetical protein